MMTKFITKSIIFFLLFIFVVTYLSEQDDKTSNSVNPNSEEIVLSSAELYDVVEEQSSIATEVSGQESLTYHVAQIIEQSGLLIYEGLITIITDLTKLI